MRALVFRPYDVWSKPLPLRGGLANGITLTDAIADLNNVVVDLVHPAFNSPVVTWKILVDGGEAGCHGDAGPDRLFGPVDEFTRLRDVGLKPSSFRFLIAFVASSESWEVPEVEQLTCPIEGVEYLLQGQP